MGPIRRWIAELSPRTEFVLVVAGAFGYFSLGSLLAVLFPGPTPPITQAHLTFLLIFESITLIFLGGFLHLRGWNARKVGLEVTARGCFLGLGLALTAYAAYVLIWLTVAAVGIHPSYRGNYRELASHGLTLTTVIAVAILNPIYEETFLCGYIVTFAKQANHTITGVNISVAIRLLYHLYQGGVGVIGIIPTGLIFAWWYARTGRLWPVFVAHALFDAIGLLQFVGNAS
jgi:CAAX protease family protein